VPELPEVETLRRDLLAAVVGATVARVEALDPKIVAPATPEAFAAALAGETIAAVERRGKWLLLPLASGSTWIVHRGMSGFLYLRQPEDAPDRFLRALIHLADGRELRYCDARRFGRLWVASREELAALDARLGPEPLGEDFTPAYLAWRLRGRQAPIKAVLLDQRLVAGVGNIYANEALFQARIHPRRPAGSLTPEEVERLHGAIVDVLARGILNRGTTLRDYRDLMGQPGRNQEALAVHDRAGAPCPICGTPIERLVLGGRSAYFCPQCQG